MFWSKNKKKVYPCKPQFYYIKMGCKGVFVTRTRFRDVRIQRGFRRFARTPFETKSFHFHDDISEELREYDLKLKNRTPFVILNPISRNPGSGLVANHLQTADDHFGRWSKQIMYIKDHAVLDIS